MIDKGCYYTCQTGYTHAVIFKQTKNNIKRLVNNPKKHIKRTPGSRFEGMAKVKKKKTKST
ncbi:hypothetical protein COD67_19755 [Bacillus cereus]|nr:hypothetical protein COI89_11985 [Bacillus cereus]PGU63869.1 hypothetical protein COD67_19755 [Bacillus cereus]